ncbi:hypothetical protein [Microbulbifer spongiae]|uniref:Lipoprotein n=1 Tax=Microbulbifer spongiae TaxID=2944933 RepID=A0ABY9EBQ2_9GAMM|nr:hypothetical protein [Microbulbifer sp. MI-G]WKD48944.1 hypothetical protein M8T91_13720 [Microbulbifer sp. MI-G]
MKTTFLIVLFCLILASCASVRPQNATNYNRDLVVAVETSNFVLGKREVFDEPALGILLEYANRFYPTDNIDVYIYPVPSINWEDKISTIDQEMKQVIAEVDHAIKDGHYQSRTEEKIEPFSVDGMNGKKASFRLKSKKGVMYYSNAYIFLDKDKFIKFRTSFDSRATIEWDGDEAVREILPEIDVPRESEYMKTIRDNHRDQLSKNLLIQILKAASEQEKNPNKQSQQGPSDGMR